MHFFLGALRVKDIVTLLQQVGREHSGSVVECLSRDRRAEGSSPLASLRCGP